MKRATGAVMAALVIGMSSAGPAEAARPSRGAQHLGVAECAVDVTTSGMVLTATHVVRDGRVRGLPGGLTEAVAINDRGQVLGAVGAEPVLWDGRRTVALTPAAADPDERWRFDDVSATGVTVGDVSEPWPSQERTAFRRAKDGTITRLTAPGVRSGALAVNASGQVVGDVWDGDLQVAVRWDADGTTTRLESLGGHSLAIGINDAGQAVGYSYRTDGTIEPVSWSADGAVTALGGTGSALAVNARGDVVGEQYSPQRAFVRTRAGSVRTFPAPDDGVSMLSAVNSRGWAVGCELAGDTESAIIVRA
ncbi:hypothetical protein [uncultured Cellulomonas sp.]|uniref:hypothetical protein n=1 Tax=uncultured Cellulomonas sp. TaxID=189682 RepID=UPI0026333305|nr:hypothetical protein [uncultured Cellulomonas sp.]